MLDTPGFWFDWELKKMGIPGLEKPLFNTGICLNSALE
jgi:hypothetical protein